MTPEKSSTSFVQPFPQSNLKVDAEAYPEIIRIEIMSDNDYFFQFVYEVDAYEFGKLKETSGLKVDFHGFLTMLIKLINQAIEDEKQF
jgi:hypothetical protein